jgi:hypothetical protein
MLPLLPCTAHHYSTQTHQSQFDLAARRTCCDHPLTADLPIGDARYGQFKDKLGHYSDRDHNDKARRASYYKRHGPATDKNTAKYWSHKILW